MALYLKLMYKTYLCVIVSVLLSYFMFIIPSSLGVSGVFSSNKA